MVHLQAAEPSTPHNRHDGLVAEMKTTGSKRRSLGVPQTLQFIQRSLRLPSSDESPDKPGALLEVRTLVQTIIDQTRAGDGECGYFLAELAVFLWKFRERFEVHNDIFRSTFAKLESSRPTTKKSSPLRALIYRIIRDARSERFNLDIARRLRVARFFPDHDKLLRLPEFGPSPEAINAWTCNVVYPRLRAMESELCKDPEISKIKKAWG